MRLRYKILTEAGKLVVIIAVWSIVGAILLYAGNCP
jgi:hypothetical protein